PTRRSSDLVQALARRAAEVHAQGLLVIAGAVLGLAGAGLCAWSWTRYGRKLNPGVILKVTALFLGLFLLQQEQAEEEGRDLEDDARVQLAAVAGPAPGAEARARQAQHGPGDHQEALRVHFGRAPGERLHEIGRAAGR